MKAKKLLGALALTAALAMGTMPAFASTNAPSDWLNGTDQGIGGAGVSDNTAIMNVNQVAGSNTKVGTGSTAIKATVFDADLNVTVPLQLSVAFASTGSELTCPSPGVYKITNNSAKNDVQLTRIQGRAIGFTLTKAAAARATFSGAGSNDYQIGFELKINNKVIDLKAAETFGASNGGGWLEEQGDTANNSSNPFVPTSGDPAKVIIPAGGNLGIDVSGSTNYFPNNPISVGYQGSTLAEISYTVQTTGATA